MEEECCNKKAGKWGFFLFLELRGCNWHACLSSPVASVTCKRIYPFFPTAKKSTTHALFSWSAPRLTCQHQSPGPGVHSPKQLYAKLKRQTTVPGREQRKSCEMRHCPALSLSSVCRARATGRAAKGTQRPWNSTSSPGLFKIRLSGWLWEVEVQDAAHSN